MRPISLFEVTRKLWLGIISRRITAVWDAFNILGPTQHGFRSKHGTETALIQLISSLESALEEDEYLLTAWDIKRAFDSIPRPLISLSWRRMGLEGLSLWLLTSIDSDGLTFPWSPYMMRHIASQNPAGKRRALHLIRSSTLSFIAREELAKEILYLHWYGTLYLTSSSIC
jgi:hypothetical protein